MRLMVTAIQPGNVRREVGATTTAISLASVKCRFGCSVFGELELRFRWPFECVGVVSETDVTELTLFGNETSQPSW
jgi:hypothetical protein